MDPETLNLSDGLCTLQLGDADWRMDSLGTIVAIEEWQKANPEHTSRQRLDEIKNLVAAAGGPQLNDTAADQVFFQLNHFWVSKKNEQRAAMDELAKLPSSTE